jgi:MraZ protein
MTMLLGEHHCPTDGEGRLTVPAEFRTELADGVIVTRGIERCLFVYPATEWRKLADKMQNRLPLTNRLARAFKRLLFSGALTCAPDQRGRICLPALLRQYANIGDEVVVVGLVSHLEIWNSQQWQEMSAALADDGVTLAEELGEFGI